MEKREDMYKLFECIRNSIEASISFYKQDMLPFKPTGVYDAPWNLSPFGVGFINSL